MGSETNGRLTRREYIGTGSALVGAGALAGCTGTGAESDDDGDGSGSDGGPYTVSMSPVGEVEFDGVPESAFVAFPQYADAAVALGHGDVVNTLFSPEMSGATMNGYYERLPGVSFDYEGLENPLTDGLSEENLYALDSDVHFIDPAYVVSTSGWERSDVDRVADQVGPWFGNFYSGTHDQPPESYRDGYEYYGLWEVVERVARVFDETERYEALAEIHADLLSTIESGLPPEDERPTVARVSFTNDTFYALYVNADGYWQADTRPLGAKDVFAGEEWNLWGTLDYETMLDVDPDVILNLWGTAPGYYAAETRETIANDDVGRKLSAIRNDRFYASGMRYQGPIMNLFQLEMTAKQFYPEQFGEWPGYPTGGPYPEIPEAERLFDRQRLADVVTGEF
ncbi:ABC transporter substrate-binding protein [Halostella litorea]|uniref:ABC transporter substrate-binding protein n=1 Tax=Halostella litorea TaxID=2528831 RepID=UPI001093114F|nr:ABC transporter substrate-binding protein [Halostella litorea]